MCLCVQISNRAQCVFNGISIVLACWVASSFIVYRKQYDPYHCILLGSLVITMVGAFCLIFGAALMLKALLWVWIGVSLPATLLVALGYGLIIGTDWDATAIFANTMDMIMLILYTGMILVSLCFAVLFLRELSRGEE